MGYFDAQGNGDGICAAACIGLLLFIGFGANKNSKNNKKKLRVARTPIE